MNILIAGGSGFIGKHLEKYLHNCGHKVYILSRSNSNKTHYIHWDGITLNINLEINLIINLCGVDIAGGRWSKSYIQKIINSRVEPTQAIVDFIKKHNSHPKPMLINASAIGCYPSCKQVQDETNNLCAKNHNQSKEIVSLWEKAALRAEEHNATVKILRFGVVIGKDGGFMQKIMPAIKVRLGIIFGRKDSHMSWVHVADLCRAIEFIANKNPQPKIYNITAPQPSTQLELMQAISKHYKTLLIFSLPPEIIKLMFGKMGEELLLADQNIKPKNLEDNGFEFGYKNIDSAIKQIMQNH